MFVEGDDCDADDDCEVDCDGCDDADEGEGGVLYAVCELLLFVCNVELICS